MFKVKNKNTRTTSALQSVQKKNKENKEKKNTVDQRSLYKISVCKNSIKCVEGIRQNTKNPEKWTLFFPQNIFY